MKRVDKRLECCDLFADAAMLELRRMHGILEDVLGRLSSFRIRNYELFSKTELRLVWVDIRDMYHRIECVIDHPAEE